jgi:Ca2+-transporting ATPase
MKTRDQFFGLTDEGVEESRKLYGWNKRGNKEANRFLKVLKDVVSEPLFVILVLTSLIYFLLGEFSEGIIMLVALAFVSGIAIFQENRSRNAVAALNKLSTPLAKVIRNGSLQQIPSNEIVIDDLINVEDGDLIPADAVIVKQNDFSVNESILTGESLSVFKSVNDGNNKIFQGTQAISGSCIAQVKAIGRETAFGKIGESLTEIDQSKTPLQLQIKSFIRSMVSIGVIAFLIVWAVNYILSGDILHALLRGLTLAMSILPEEIPVAFSTFMALGAYRLYKKKVIARSPHTVETLGAATVICVDKTGTITENRMEVALIYEYANDKYYDYTGDKPEYNEVLNYAMWASETDPFDNMEKSIHKLYTSTASLDQRKDFRMVHEYPLGGTPPIMTHVFKSLSGELIIACKGSLEGVLSQCALSDDEKAEIQSKAGSIASKGYRVLGVCKSSLTLNELPATQDQIEFEFLGLIAFNDPPKKNMNSILQQFYEAGIRVKIITGDHAETTLAIADQIGFNKGTGLLTGEQVLKMDSKELSRNVSNVNIFARMFPEAKLKVIEALKSNNEVVAMTGDGVNDAPALKAAHIGIAMGKRGSEVARNAASLILMDDDLIHMPEAVALGRRIYENLKKAIQYIISIHIPIILIVALPLILFWKFNDIFSPIHVIILELIMGPTCSIIYENEPMEANYMKKAPRKMSSAFFSFKELSLSITQGLIITLACLSVGYFYMESNHSETLVRTCIYTTLIFSNLFLTLSNRSFYYSIFTTIRYKNNLIPLILTISLIILFSSVYITPIQEIFRFEALSLLDLTRCFIAALVGVMWIEVYKFRKRRSEAEQPLRSVSIN